MPYPSAARPRPKKPRKSSGLPSVATPGTPQATFKPPVFPGPPKGLPAPAANTGPVYKPYVRPEFGKAPPSGAGNAIRSDAEQAMTGARTTYADSAWRAAMKLGDKTAWDKLVAEKPEMFTGYTWADDPNSMFAQIASRETDALQDVNDQSLRGNTFFSGLRINDRNEVSEQAANDRGAAGTSFQEALLDYARALQAANDAYRSSGTQASQADLDYAISQEPDPGLADISPEGVPYKGAPVAQPLSAKGATPAQAKKYAKARKKQGKVKR
jgi:hypothetical protein